MHWGEFKAQAPSLAQLGEERFERTGLCLLGTIRRNGYPRISPVEILLLDGKLYLGMEWRSRKALDLLRDPRCTVNSVIPDKDSSDQFKLFGRAEDVTDLEERARYCVAMSARLGVEFKAEDEFHLFAIELESASFGEIRDEQWYREFWSEEQGGD